MEDINTPYIYKNHLLPLSRCEDYQVADGDSDVRGWDVIGSEGEKFGKIHDLLVDLNAMKVRYLDIDINDSVWDDDEKLQMIVPVGTAILNKDDKNVVLPKVSVANLRAYPLYRREPIYLMRDYERAVKDYYSGEGKYEHRRFNDFYEGEYYNDTNFYKRDTY